jgi:hypothetical protein
MLIGGTITLIIGLAIIYFLQWILMPLVKKVKDGLESVVNCFKRPDRCIANLAGGVGGAVSGAGRSLGFGQETGRKHRNRRRHYDTEFRQSLDIGAAVEGVKKAVKMLQNVFSNLVLYMFYGLMVVSLFMMSGFITFQPAIIAGVLGAVMIPLLIRFRSVFTSIAKATEGWPVVGDSFSSVADEYNVLAPWVLLGVVTCTMYMVPSLL